MSSRLVRGLRVQVASYNAGEQYDGSKVPDLTEWLVPTLTESRRSGYVTRPAPPSGPDAMGPREAPDIYAVAFQEFAPLSSALAGQIQVPLAKVDTEIRRTVRLHQSVVRDDHMYDPLEMGGGPENYAKIAEVSHGGLVLFVYARERAPQHARGIVLSAAQRVKEVRTSYVGTGIGMIMGNKGAVGARVTLASAVTGARDEVITFVCAHLAAHDHKVARRNADWRNIVERLVFDPASTQPPLVLQEPTMGPGQLGAVQSVAAGRQTLTPSPLDQHEYSLYDTHHLFVLGDLNYRVATGVEGVSPQGVPVRPGSFPPITRETVRAAARSFQPSQWAEILPYDQLSIERAAVPARTMHSLFIPDMAHLKIPPTYKYKAGGEMEQMSKKRLPGWPDRLLWASSDAMQGNEALRCELYRSLMRYTASDHKPITAIVELPYQLDPLTEFLPVPYDLHPYWRSMRTLGRCVDRLVGYLWMLLLTFGHGHLALALLEIGLLVLVAMYWLPGHWPW
ncbi:phosphatidylinositol-4,5-bisphosphate 5-phosphatase [Malassezia pachydermatis]|uniref:Inositol polyphosphate phosphatase n=1 Tax=Malassezia pachydermatis TaxID=77020 RepID=A0A0M8MK64_9BASI|nr:inositol polyphosphate phosphatase [Malassezia pachydermatis]KOS14116.1 inositol polyphosphate phosphatase [Malassezia pachydermatis]